VRPGLTLEDGTLVVTDNYLKVRIASGRGRNEPVSVRLRMNGDALEGEVVAEGAGDLLHQRGAALPG